MTYYTQDSAHYNFDAILRLGGGIIGLIAMLEKQAVFDGICVHENEFQSSCDYMMFVEPLYHVNEDITAKAVSYISRFFYLKGMQDGVHIKDNLFNKT